jgi:hypothetical protein
MKLGLILVAVVGFPLVGVADVAPERSVSRDAAIATWSSTAVVDRPFSERRRLHIEGKSLAETVIERARWPIAGAVGGGGRVVLLWHARVRTAGGARELTAYRVMDDERVVAQGLIRSVTDEYNVAVAAVPGGFLTVGGESRAAFVSRSGGVWAADVRQRAVMPRVGDLPVGLDGSLVYRPSTRRVVGDAKPPAGADVTYADGHGRWWAIGGEEGGQRVAWSVAAGEPWVKHLVGPYSDSYGGCTCQWWPAVRGRGEVVVVATGDVQHVSVDDGATWRTWDLRDTEPYRATYENLREPFTSSLPDGRIVTGYVQWWIANDSANETFRLISVWSRPVWLAGLSQVPRRKRDSVSVDGGTTWVPLDVQPRNIPDRRVAATYRVAG